MKQAESRLMNIEDGEDIIHNYRLWEPQILQPKITFTNE
jgi:hypothetical protein